MLAFQIAFKFVDLYLSLILHKYVLFSCLAFEAQEGLELISIKVASSIHQVVKRAASDIKSTQAILI